MIMETPAMPHQSYGPMMIRAAPGAVSSPQYNEMLIRPRHSAYRGKCEVAM